MAAIPGAANASPIRAMARPRKRRWPPSRRCRNRCGAGSTGRPCRPRCRPAPPATRWIARCMDLEAKTSGQRVWDLLGRPAPKACITAYTISLASPEAMAAATAKAAHRPLLKIKLGGDGDGARIAAVRKAAPDSELIVDANEAWTIGQSRAKPRRMRAGRRHPGRAAAAGRPGRGAGAHPPAARGLRRRKRA